MFKLIITFLLILIYIFLIMFCKAPILLRYILSRKSLLPLLLNLQLQLMLLTYNPSLSIKFISVTTETATFRIRICPFSRLAETTFLM